MDVIGYSAGGVIARAVRAGRRRRRRRTPGAHAGLAAPRRRGGRQSPTTLAGGCPKACEQLAIDSDLLRRLNAGDETPAGPTWVTVRSDADQTVTPTDSAELDGALNLRVQDLCPDATTSHGALPGDPVVLATLRSRPGSGHGARALGRQLLMSLVAKLAQAALANTSR